MTRAGSGSDLPRIGCAPLLAAAWLVALAVALSLVPGCGASAAVRESYAATVLRCVAEERQIVDRDSTPEEDARDVAALRERCAAELAVIGGVP